MFSGLRVPSEGSGTGSPRQECQGGDQWQAPMSQSVKRCSTNLHCAGTFTKLPPLLPRGCLIPRSRRNPDCYVLKHTHCLKHKSSYFGLRLWQGIWKERWPVRLRRGFPMCQGAREAPAFAPRPRGGPAVADKAMAPLLCVLLCSHRSPSQLLHVLLYNPGRKCQAGVMDSRVQMRQGRLGDITATADWL